MKISRKKSSYLILLTMMLVISMGNYFNADYLVYERMYNNAEYSRLEPGFSLLMSLGKTIGLSYHQFAVMVILLGFIIILSALKNLNITNYVLLAYLFYPFLLDVTQIRFFLSVAIFVYSSKYLINDDKISIVKYLICIFLSASIHISSLFYLIFILLKLKNYSVKKFVKLSIIFIAISFVFIVFLNNNQIPFIDNLLKIFDMEMYYVYFNTKVDFGFIIPMFYYLASIYLLKKSLSIIRKSEYYGDKEEKFGNLVLGMHIISIILFPLFLVNLQFIRFYRSLAILKYSVFALTDLSIKRKTKLRYSYNIQVILFVVINFVLELILQDRFTRVFIPLFENNLLFK